MSTNSRYWYISWIISTGWWTWIIQSILITLQFGFCRHCRQWWIFRHWSLFKLEHFWMFFGLPFWHHSGRSNGMLLTHRCLLEANSRCFCWKLKWLQSWCSRGYQSQAEGTRARKHSWVRTLSHGGWLGGFVRFAGICGRNWGWSGQWISMNFVLHTMRRISWHCNPEFSQNCKELTKEL